MPSTGEATRSTSTWAPLRSPVFRALWIAQLVSNLGTWMQTVGAQWMLVGDPRAAVLVPLVQTATTLPVVLLVRRRAAWHRPLGRAAAALLLVAAAAGFPSALLSEATGIARAGFAAQAMICALFVAQGWHAIRGRDGARHARCMMRAAAVLSGVLWLRVAMPVAVWLWLPFDEAYAGIAWGCWALPLAAVLLAQRWQSAAPGPGPRRPMDQFAVMRTSGFGTVQQAPSESMKTTQSRCASAP